VARIIHGAAGAIIVSDPVAVPAVRGCVAVAVVVGQNLSATVGVHFGRAPRFLLLRGGPEGTVKTLENPHAEDSHGAGAATAALLRQQGVTAALAGQFGPKAEDALRAGGILPVTVPPGTKAAEALTQLPPEMLEKSS
jgi:predicted Fe-Mo cluster-binding NifX family protein